MNSLKVREILASAYVSTQSVDGGSAFLMRFEEHAAQILSEDQEMDERVLAMRKTVAHLHHGFKISTRELEHQALHLASAYCSEALLMLSAASGCLTEFFDEVKISIGQDPKVHPRITQGICVGTIRGVKRHYDNNQGDKTPIAKYFEFLWKFVSFHRSGSNWEKMSQQVLGDFKSSVGQLAEIDFLPLTKFATTDSDEGAEDLSNYPHEGHLALQLSQVISNAVVKRLRPVDLRQCLKVFALGLETDRALSVVTKK